MSEDFSVTGVLFPQIVDPEDLDEEVLPFNLKLVNRFIRTRNDNTKEEFERQIEDIFLSLVANPTEEEFDDGFIPLDSYGVSYTGIDANSDIPNGSLIVNLSLQEDKHNWVDDSTREIFIQSLIVSIKQTGVKNVDISFI